MRSNRVIAVVCLLGVVIIAVTFLGAAKMSGDDKAGKENQNVLSPIKNGSKGVVFFGVIDVDNGVGLVDVYPENLPQPSRVVKVLKREGDTVKAGDALVEFDATFADIKVAEATEGLAKAKAALQGAEELLTQATQNDELHKLAIEGQRAALKGKEAELEAAKIKWREKYDKAGKVGAQTDPGLQAAQKELEAAQHQLETERKKLKAYELANPSPLAIAMPKSRAIAGVAETKAAVRLQEVKLREALYGKGLTVLTARFDGKIVRSHVTEGMTFGVQTHQPAFRIQPTGAVIVRAEVDQEWASRVAKDQEAEIEDDGNRHLKWKGRVIRVGDSFLPKRSNQALPEGVSLTETRVLECIISIDSGETRYPLRVGQCVKVKIEVPSSNP